MPDREKVIKGLEIQLDDLQKYADSDEMLTLTQEQAKEILALLKEQETSNLYKCPNCGTWVSAENVVRCKDCKWNNGYTGCDKYLLPHGGDWYCADGEVKDGQD